MTTKRSFFIVLRIVFVLFSIVFIFDAAHKWDGYSFYVRFAEFLPDLSLAFILWTIPGIIAAVVLWLFVYGVFRIISGFSGVRIEHIIVFFITAGLPLVIKRIFFSHISLGDIFGSSHFMTLAVGGGLVVVFVWFVRGYCEKILHRLNDSITLIVWLFVFLLILAVPFSVFKKGSSNAFIPESSAHITAHEEKNRPNIILVTMDTLTAMDMQVYGYERQTTPFLTDWAKNAIVFDKVYASSNWTPPTAMSLMTGQKPWTHKVWYQNVFRHVNSYENNLPSVLKDYGYPVYGFIQIQHAHPETLGIDNAFLMKDKVHTFEIPSRWWFNKLANIFRNRPIVNTWIFDDNPIANEINFYRPNMSMTLTPPEIVYNRFLEYISRRGQQQPFFAWLHVSSPRIPYLPPKPYIGMFGDAEEFNSDIKQYRSGVLGEYLPEKQADVDILRKRYDENILYSDQQFKDFLLRIAKVIDMSNTIIILSADHGESFSHGYQGHAGNHLYESLVRIPLIIKMPSERKGNVINMPVSQIDIAPTILDLAGIPAPDWMEGRSLLPLVKGKSLDPRPVYSMQLIENRSFGEPITKGTIALREGDYKLIYYLEDKKSLLFDLRSDPDEMQDITQQKQEVTKRLTRLIVENLSRANTEITKSAGNNFQLIKSD